VGKTLEPIDVCGACCICKLHLCNLKIVQMYCTITRLAMQSRDWHAVSENAQRYLKMRKFLDCADHIQEHILHS